MKIDGETGHGAGRKKTPVQGWQGGRAALFSWVAELIVSTPLVPHGDARETVP